MFERIWNGRLIGIPNAIFNAFNIIIQKSIDSLSTNVAKGGLGKFGKNSKIQSGVTIRYPGNIIISEGVHISRGVEIGSEVSGSTLEVGSKSQVGKNSRIDFTGDVEIGSNVVISERVTIFTHSHGQDPHSTPIKTPLVIEKNVWIGANAIILEGVGKIGEGSLIAAGSIVTREIPAYSLAAGVPARVIRKTDAFRDKSSSI